MLRHVIGHSRARWPAVDIVVRGDSHLRPAGSDGVVRAQGRRLHFGLAGNNVRLRQVSPLAEDAALDRLAGEGKRSPGRVVNWQVYPPSSR